jgi:uncharacterized repeat protein (TIGR03803 family)
MLGWISCKCLGSNGLVAEWPGFTQCSYRNTFCTGLYIHLRKIPQVQWEEGIVQNKNCDHRSSLESCQQSLAEIATRFSSKRPIDNRSSQLVLYFCPYDFADLRLASLPRDAPEKEVRPVKHLRLFAALILLAPVLAVALTVAPTATTETVLHSFAPYRHGDFPLAGLVSDAVGNLYGTTYYGGDYNWGTVFRLSRGANGQWTETVLHSFANGTDGAQPAVRLIFDASGNLYGMTSIGGSTLCKGNSRGPGCGTVFELSPGLSGKWKEKILYTFATTSLSDSYYPTGELVFDSAGNLYSTASGGGAYNSGTVFELSPGSAGWTENILYSFTGSADGLYPASGLAIDANGNLYGTTQYGGDFTCNANNGYPKGCGVIFELAKTTGGWSQSVLYTFSGTWDSWNGPASQLIFDRSGNLFGDSENGTFELQPAGQGSWTLTFLPAPMIGDLTLDSAGNLYGTNPYASVLELVRGQNGSWTELQLYVFQQGSDGAYPYGGLVLDSLGNLYGTASQTFDHRYGGLVFEVSPNTQGSWTENVLYRFSSTEGSTPQGALVADSQGNLYGTTFQGGTSSAYCPDSQAFGCGTVFKMTRSPSGSWKSSMIYNFTDTAADGAGPAAGLIIDEAGNLYGTTQYGGKHHNGTVFKLTPQPSGGWTRMTLYSFGAYPQDGIWPNSTLVRDAAGNLYGTTPIGGLSGCGLDACGTVFRISPTSNGSWIKSTLYMFTGSLGATPNGGLSFDSAGNLYGTASGGDGYGTAFRLSPGGGGIWTMTILYAFTGGADGGFPKSGLTFDGSGNLFGTTSLRGNTSGCGYGCGTVFELTPTSTGAWQFAVIHTFSPANDGAYPLAARLIFDAAGNLYGTTAAGGISSLCYDFICGGGTVFELVPTSSGQWTEQIVHTFSGPPVDGAAPAAGLVEGLDGHLFGTTRVGGSYSAGSVFEIAP